MKDPDSGDWVVPLNGFRTQAEESVCSLKLSFYDLQGIKLNLAVCRKQVDWLFLLTVYIIVKLLLKFVQEIMLQLGVFSNYAPRGRDIGSFLWKNIGSG